MPSLGEVMGLARGAGPQAPAAIDAIGAHRRTVATSLLSSSDNEAALAQRIDDVAELAASAFPWDPTAEDYELSRAILERWASAPAPPINVLMAAMALAPAHHFPAPLRLALLPPWLRVAYARFLVGSPPIFLHAGEADRYAIHNTAAMRVLREAALDDHLPEAADLARIAYQADSIMIYFNDVSLHSYFRDKSKLLEWSLLNQKFDLNMASPLSKNDLPKVGILHRSLAPSTETYYLLAHLEGRETGSLDVTLYILDGSPSPLHEVCARWVDRIVQLPSDISGAVTRIRQDRLDLCLITNNIAGGASPQTVIAAHRLAKTQVIGAASPVTVGLSSSDLFLSGVANEPSPSAQDDYEEGLVRLPGAVTYYGFAHDKEPRTLTCTRESLGVPENQVLFFSAANYYKITPELLTAWAEILARVPNSMLVLMPFNPNWHHSYPVALFLRRLTRKLSRFGVAANRVNSIAKVPTRADLHEILGLADIYLDSFPFSGACSLVDPLLLGLPIVARKGRTFRSSVASSVLVMDGLDEAVCPDVDAYVERSVRLAEQIDFVQRRRERVRPDPAPSSTLTTPYAHKFTAFCRHAIATQHRQLDDLRSSATQALRDTVETTLGLALQDPPPAFQRFNDIDLGAQLLVSYVETLAADGAAAGRVIDVGACLGALSAPFLQAGFRAEMFEPDPDCAAAMRALIERFPSLATHHVMAVTQEAVDSVSFNKRSIGLSGLGDSPFGEQGARITVPATTLRQYLNDHGNEVDVIKIDAEGSDFDILRGIDLAKAKLGVIMVEFGVHFPNQSVLEIRRLVTELRASGYDAAIFEYRKLSGFGSANWDHELVDVALNADRLGERGDAFGNIVFYRRDDRTFLACLIKLLENFVPARHRPLAVSFRD